MLENLKLCKSYLLSHGFSNFEAFDSAHYRFVIRLLLSLRFFAKKYIFRTLGGLGHSVKSAVVSGHVFLLFEITGHFRAAFFGQTCGI